MNKKPRLIGIIAALTLFGGILLAAQPLRATPLVSWEPSSVTQEVTSGESIVFVATGTALGTLPNAVVVVSSELANLITVTPANPGTIPRGKSFALTIKVTPSATMSPEIIEGAIALHKKESTRTTFVSTLPVKIVVKWPQIANDGVSVDYPADWSLDQRMLNLGETIRITNFGTAYLNGGIVPDGGAQISVLTIALPDVSIEEIIAEDTEGDQVESVEDIEVASSPGKRVTFEFDLGGRLRYRRIAAYIPRDAQLHKFILDYRSDDQNEARFLETFDRILSAATFN